MKKILSLALVLVMVLSVAVTAIAAPATVKGQNPESEVATATTSLLKAVTAAGFIKGDGAAAPSANSKLTRWQVALIALRVDTLDLNDENWADYVVDYGNEDVIYADTDEAYAKSLGAILYVQANGLIKGYEEDGAVYFKPAQYVTYAEALTLFVRLCGWDSVAMNQNWPYNYVAQAQLLGLTDGITGVGLNDEVTYGTIAKLIYNFYAADKYLSIAMIDELLAIFGEDSQFSDELKALKLSGNEARKFEGSEDYAVALLSELGTVTFEFGVFDLDGNYYIFDESADDEPVDLGSKNKYGRYEPTGKFTAWKNDTTVGAIMNGVTGWSANDQYDWIGATRTAFNVEADEGGWSLKDDTYFLYETEDEFKLRLKSYGMLSFYELDEDGQPILETREFALLAGAKADTSATYATKKAADKNFALVGEPLTQGDYLVAIDVKGDVYYQRVPEDVVEDAIEEAIEDIDLAAIADLIDMEEIKEVAAIYLMEGYVCTGLNINQYHPGVNKVLADKFGDDCVYLLSDEEIAILSDDWVFSDGGDQVDPGFTPGSFDWDKENDKVYHLALAMLDASNTVAELGYDDCKTILDYAYQRTFNAYYAAAVEAATLAAIDESIKDYFEAPLAALETADLLRWSAATVICDAYQEDMVVGKYVEFRGVYVEDSVELVWVGAENAIGSYVKEVTTIDGVVTEEIFASKLYTMPAFGGAGVVATELSAEVVYVGEKTANTYGAWAIDTNGDAKFDVVVYANFID